MSEEQIEWYGGMLGRANKDAVTLERNGQIAIGYDLMADWPAGCGKARVGHKKATGQILVQPVATAGGVCLKIQRPATDRRAARIAACGALKTFGLLRDKPRPCTAAWEHGVLVITPEDATPRPRADEARDRHDEEKAAALDAAIEHEDAPSDERRATPLATGHGSRVTGHGPRFLNR